MPTGHQLAQTAHAAGESASEYRFPVRSGTTAIILAARNHEHIQAIHQQLLCAGIPHTPIYEPDPPYLGQMTAIGFHPTADRDRLRPFTKKLGLLR